MSKIVDYVSEDNKNDMLNDVRDSDYDAFVKLSQVFEFNVFCVCSYGRGEGLGCCLSYE